MNILKAAELWEKFTGIEFDPKIIHFGSAKYDIAWDANKALKEYSVYDYENGYMLGSVLYDAFRKYIKKVYFTLESLIFDTEDTDMSTFIANAKDLNKELDDDDFKLFHNSLMEWWKNQLVKNGAEQTILDDVLPGDLAKVVLNARKNVNNFTWDRVVNGSIAGYDQMVLSNIIYAFKSTEQLLISVRNDDFKRIRLCAVLNDKYPECSYFLFAVNTGSAVFLVSDKVKNAYPLQHERRRTPGRDMAERIDLAHFPYELINISLSKYKASFDSTELSKVEDLQIGNIRNLNVFEQVWIYACCDEIVNVISKKSAEIKEDSVVGKAIVPKALITKESSTAIQPLFKANYPVIEVEKLTGREVFAAEMEFQNPSLHLYDWLIDRYVDQIDDGYLNGYNEEFSLVDKELDEAEPVSCFGSRFSVKDTLRSLDIESIEPETKQKYNRQWIARYNLAKIADHLAKVEWWECKNDVFAQYRKDIAEHQDEIIEKALTGKIEDIVFLEVSGLSYFDTMFTTIGEYKQGYGFCCKTGKKANIVLKIKIDSLETLCALTHKKPEEINVFIRHCFDTIPYIGNSILNNIDPLDSVPSNPAETMFNKNIYIFFTKSAYNATCKELGITPNKFWNN